ncbi:hypothetical protein EDB81DRAFT_910883 [Dactylonectria macrodidyma]|uniref:Fungal N-terminal domain-containing protein n=1 Tax=Dactylonectria macrodidyma TaxID=307937 RepID=A0A9P9DU29_9HYPO|nr:hypothetical protein EDB81DRAFT_910883 [Dactylonectria macrodidyma]
MAQLVNPTGSKKKRADRQRYAFGQKWLSNANFSMRIPRDITFGSFKLIRPLVLISFSHFMMQQSVILMIRASMDPLSIASGYAGLVTAIGSLSFSIHTFVRTCREARSDLDQVLRELHSLRTVLELIQEDAADETKSFPPSSANTSQPSCLIACEEQELVDGQREVRHRKAAHESGSTQVGAGASSGYAHPIRSLTKEIKADTTEIRNDTAAIKDSTAMILQEIARLQARLPTDAPTQNDFILPKFLEEMTTYTEQELDPTLGSHDDSVRSSRAFSYFEEYEEVGVPRYPDVEWIPLWSDDDLPGPLTPPSKDLLTDQRGSNPLERPSVSKPNVESSHALGFNSPQDIPAISSLVAAELSPQQPKQSARDELTVMDVLESMNSGSRPQETLQATDQAAVSRPRDPRQKEEDGAMIDVTAYQGNLVLSLLMPHDVLSSKEKAVEYKKWRFTAVIPAWEAVLVHIHGPPNWQGLAPDIEESLERMGIKITRNMAVKASGGDPQIRWLHVDSTHLTREIHWKRERVHGTIRQCTAEINPFAEPRKSLPIRTISTAMIQLDQEFPFKTVPTDDHSA